MSFDRRDGRGYTRHMGSGLSVAGAAVNRPDGGENGASEISSLEQRASSSDDYEHLRAKAASAELQKKTTELLLRSEQQRIRIEKEENEHLTKQLSCKDNDLAQIELQLEKQRKENEKMKYTAAAELEQLHQRHEQLEKELWNKNNQLVQKALQVDQQREEIQNTKTELRGHKEENTRLNQEIEKLTTELTHARRTLHNLSRDNSDLKKENETLASNGELLSFDFAQKNIKFVSLETKYNDIKAKAKELSLINADLQSSTNTLHCAFGENVKCLDKLTSENIQLKNQLQSTNENGEKERIMAKLQHRRELLTLVKAARAAAETKAKAVPDEGPTEFDSVEKVQAGWDSYVKNDDSIVSVLRGGDWVEAVLVKKPYSSLPWVYYCCDGVYQAVSEDKIRRKKRQRPSYFESPPSPKPKKHKKERSFYIGVA